MHGSERLGLRAMDFYYLKRSLLFKGCSKEEIQKMLRCWNAEERTYQAGEVIHRAGKPIHDIGIILEGSVRGTHTDFFGETALITLTEVGRSFGEAYACAPANVPMLDYVANENCRVLFINGEQAMHRCHHRCDCHLRVATNLTELISLRYLELMRRTYTITHKSTREKVLAFLSLYAMATDSHEFDIHYNREQMASYLGVDRSALSAELSRMKRAGLIDFRKNHFVINKTTDVL